MGTDKETNGGLYAFDLNGKMLSERSFTPLLRPNNMDVEYGNPHRHEFITALSLSTTETDGCAVAVFSFNEQFPQGFFVAMSEDKTFQVYDLRKLEAEIE